MIGTKISRNHQKCIAVERLADTLPVQVIFGRPGLVGDDLYSAEDALS